MASIASETVQANEPPGETHQTPPFSADVCLLASSDLRSEIAPLVPAELSVREFGSVETYAESVSGNVALTLVSAALPDERIRHVVRTTLSESRHARIAFVASDGGQLLRCDVPHDDEFVLPEERDSLQRALKHLYIRAYYSVTIERYYRVCLSIENYERAGGTVEEESVEKLYTARRRVHSYLRQFRAFLDTEDFGAIATREDRYNELIETGHRGGNPTAAGLPTACPDCGLDWTTWHDSRLEAGYERIGASTYRCTGCGHTLADDDPDNYRVG